MAFLSIIVPVYNKEKYIYDCIESILLQTFTDFELILVNDGSTDGSGQICDLLKKTDDRIMVFHQENQGVSSARNKGIKVASGEYLGFIDADDTIEHNMYESLINNALSNHADISICRLKSSGIKYSTKLDVEKVEILDRNEGLSAFFKEELDFSANNKIYIKQIAKNIKFEGNIFEDAYYTFQAIMLSNKNVLTQKHFYNYITRENSVSISRFSSKYLGILKVTQQLVTIVSTKAPQHLEGAGILDFVMNISLLNLILLSSKNRFLNEYKIISNNLINYSSFIKVTKAVRIKHKIAFYLFRTCAKCYLVSLKSYCLIFATQVGNRI